MKKAIRIMAAAFAVAGFILVIGSVGALENDMISFGRCLIQSAIGYCVAISAVVTARSI